MGIYVNPGNASFREAVNFRIYVDKSELITYTNTCLRTMQKYLCVSRPRRFGKSMAADMLAAYYSRGCESGTLFSGLKAEGGDSFQTHLNQHNVIRLDIQRFLESERDVPVYIEEIERKVIAELRKEYPECDGYDVDSRLKDALEQIYLQTGKGFVIIIDEWDCVFRVAKERREAQKRYLDFLRGLFKGAEYVELAYMTGILPIKKYGEHSAINIFDEYSMIDAAELATFFGFTEEEVLELCTENEIDFSQMRKWYDGYLLNGVHIYNPKSVVDVMRRRRFKSYWTGTETYEALKVYIESNFDGLKEAVIRMLGNGRCKVDPTTFQNDMTTFKTRDDVLALLIHLGYLAFDETKEEVFVPNREMEQEFLRAVKTGGWDGILQRKVILQESCHGAAVGEGLCRCGLSAPAGYRLSGSGGGTEMEPVCGRGNPAD